MSVSLCGLWGGQHRASTIIGPSTTAGGPGGFWTRDGPRPSLLPRQQSLQASQAPSGGWDTVFSSGVAGVLASMVRALRLADESERRRRLRAECCSELRAICVGLRLNFSGSREELVQRIEATLAHDDELAAPERPIGRLIRALAKMPGPTQAADLMAARFRAAELKRLCQPLRLNANGGKALLAGRIALELGSRKPDQGAPACRSPFGSVTSPPLQILVEEENDDSGSWLPENVVATKVLPDLQEERLHLRQERQLRRRRRLAELLAEELSSVLGNQAAAALVRDARVRVDAQ
mmetsp:Transcript_65135/g.105329  ORF Transcript_65135/g.105329 Transcript_65135/m.105329 type:complete len:294 (+) Transcript_65135:49-930(+)